MRPSLRHLPYLLLVCLLLASCSRSAAGTASSLVAQPEPTATPETLRATATATTSPTRTPRPSSTPRPPTREPATATVLPTSTATATRPAATATAGPPTATPLHPLSIEEMRRQDYPASEIVIEETLAPGAGHNRYVVSYRSGSYKINALLTVPAGEPPAGGWPVVIFNHGYIRPDIYLTVEDYAPHVDALARHQYIVLKPDYRGHAQSGGSRSSGYGSPDYTIDVLNALAAIQAFPAADPERIGMWGHSLGGQLTLRAMVVTDRIRAGVIWAGVVASYPALLTEWRPPGSPTFTSGTPVPGSRRGWQQRLVDDYGTPAENPAFWAAISPNSYLHDLSGPLQLHHGTADEIVPYQFSESLEEEALAAGRWAELLLYEEDDHNLSASFLPAVISTIVFFDRYLK